MTAMARPALLYFLLWLGVSLSSAMRIIGGQPCSDTERQYHVMVLPKSCTGIKTLCGGSLIRDRWVLTAAHCVPRGGTVKVVVNVHPGGKGQEMNIKPADIHLEPHKHDVVLLKLPKKPKKIYKIDIPNANDCKNDIKENKDKFQVAGHGYTAYDPKKRIFYKQSLTQLLCLNNVSVIACGAEDVTGHCPHIPVANTFCARDKGRQTAPGDSGSGALSKGKIYGIVLGGPPVAFARPFYFARICRYRDWIEKTAKP